MRTLLKQYTQREMRAASSPEGGDGRKRPPLRYSINLDLMSLDLRASFVQSQQDEETTEFLRAARQQHTVTGGCSDLLYGTILSRTSANALTFRGGMFVLSRDNARRLIHGAMPPAEEPAMGSGKERKRTLIDIGAGDGGVTKRMAWLFDSVSATEASYPMQWRLWKEGYTVVRDLSKTREQYDCVALMNVLDRADKPLSLLQEMQRLMKPGGIAVLAVVLPWCPFVEVGNRQQAPTEVLPMVGGRCGDKAPFEHCVQLMADTVLKPAGFEIIRWTRVPYLCEGGNESQYYALDDALFVMRRTQTDPAR